jgi:HNH endonuclease
LICFGGCGDEITAQNDSYAHVIPNALGGRLGAKGLICRKCNNVLDKAADNALVESFGPWPTVLRISRQKGTNPSQTLETRDGDKVRLAADGSGTRVNVDYDLKSSREITTAIIAAGDRKTVRQLIERAKKDFPNLDLKEAAQHVRAATLSPDSELKVHVNFAPSFVFGGAISIFWLFWLFKTGRPIMTWEMLLTVIKHAQETGWTLRYYVNGLPGLHGPEIELGHKIVMRAVPASGQLIAYVELFSTLKMGGVIAEGGPGHFDEFIYAFDVRSTIDRSDKFSIDAAEFDSQVWSSVGLGCEDPKAFNAYLTKCLKHLESQIPTSL